MQNSMGENPFPWNKLERVGTSWNKNIWELVPVGDAVRQSDSGEKGSEGKVLRIDGPFRAQGFLSLTAFQAEGCGLPLCGNAYKASVTGLAVCVICDTISSATYFLVSP